MRLKKRWIFLSIIIIFFYLITWCNFGYRTEVPFNRPYFRARIKNESLTNKSLSYIYDKNTLPEDGKVDLNRVEKDIIPKNIVIKTVNIFGREKIAAEKENPTTTSNNGKDAIHFKQIPFFTKEIVVTTLIELYGEEILVERKFYPYFLFGIYEFWYFPFPFMWEVVNGVTLFKWGYI